MVNPVNSNHTAASPVTEPFTPEDQFVIFSLDRNDFALPAGIVERIIRSINITGVPGMQENVLGVINLHGQAIPVFDIRKIFNLPSGEIKLSDLFILVCISGRTISIVADSVKGITSRKDQKIIPAGEIFPGMEKILEGLIFFEDGMILIYEPEKLFTLQNLGKIDMKVLGKKIKHHHDTVGKVPPENSKKEKTLTKKAKNVKKSGIAGKGNKKTTKR